MGENRDGMVDEGVGHACNFNRGGMLNSARFFKPVHIHTWCCSTLFFRRFLF